MNVDPTLRKNNKDTKTKPKETVLSSPGPFLCKDRKTAKHKQNSKLRRKKNSAGSVPGPSCLGVLAGLRTLLRDLYWTPRLDGPGIECTSCSASDQEARLLPKLGIFAKTSRASGLVGVEESGVVIRLAQSNDRLPNRQRSRVNVYWRTICRDHDHGFPVLAMLLRTLNRPDSEGTTELITLHT